MSGEYMRASPAEMVEAIASCQRALDIARVCDQMELHPDASGAVRFLEAFMSKAHLEQMGAQAGDKAGASGRTLQ
nr:hypothetical protein [uncultured Rhodoferax sp.]